MRSESRENIDIAARCRIGGRNVEIKLRDLSSQGCRIVDCGERLCEGQPLSVRIPGLEGLAGRVCWAAKNAAGIHFYQALYQPVIDHILRLNSRQAQAA
ncbi:MAG: PilZ domain-containing protein [Sphingomonadales bacterium]|nr:PilZ domain-containing protein [Sphingomonadales bacterium]